MATKHFVQKILPEYAQKIEVWDMPDVGEAATELIHLDPAVLGVDIQLGDNGHVAAVAFATSRRVVRVPIQNRYYSSHPEFSRLLSGESACLAGIEMERLALHLYLDTRCHVSGIDLSTSLPRKPFAWPSDLLTRAFSKPEIHGVDLLWQVDTKEKAQMACRRAWISACIAEHDLHICSSGGKLLKTSSVNLEHLLFLSTLVFYIDIIRAANPKEVLNDFKDIEMNDKGLIIHNARYNTRVRKGHQTSIRFETTEGDSVVGRTVRVDGKRTEVQTWRTKYRGTINRVRIIGRNDLTLAERARNKFILRVLRGEASLSSPFILALYFNRQLVRPERQTCQFTPTNHFGKLNPSQQDVLKSMILGSSPFSLVHGPPGSGKTTVIAAAIHYWSTSNRPVWTVAQSNVGVKNIALSLLKHGVDFKLIVSKEFLYEWHEHLYERLKKHVIRCDELKLSDRASSGAPMLGKSQVVLCTVSMLSNPVLDEVYLIRPVERLVIDEASQIYTHEFMHIVDKFKKLDKLCYFGDPKQLPPFGKELAPSLPCIFDVGHLQKDALFLNTQYRMPSRLGSFISEEVYNSKLHSLHAINDFSCVSFIDVDNSREEKSGRSWKNVEEINTIANIVRHHYAKKNFCIITQYDAQRSAIQTCLRERDLPWDCVYTVDSFQGNEADYVIVSLVRTSGPGFMTENRANVMLTRCKKGMVIVTNRVLLERTSASDTLVGRLAFHWMRNCGVKGTWIDWRLVSQQRANLPGAAAVVQQRNIVPISTNFPQLLPPQMAPDRNIAPRSRDPDANPILKNEQFFPLLSSPNVIPKPVSSQSGKCCWEDPLRMKVVRGKLPVAVLYERNKDDGSWVSRRRTSDSAPTDPPAWSTPSRTGPPLISTQFKSQFPPRVEYSKVAAKPGFWNNNHRVSRTK